MVVTDDGRRRFLESRVNKVAGQDMVLFLFSNPVIPSRTTKLTDLVEVQGGGYTSRNLVGSAWTVGKTGKDGRIPITHPLETFTFTSIPTIPTVWGYGIKQGQVLIGTGFVVPPADERPRPMLIQVAGDECEVNPGFYEALAED